MRFFSVFCLMGMIALSIATIQTAESKPVGQEPKLEIPVVFDSTSAREDQRRSWGFSAVVDPGGHRVLFDAGSDPIILLEQLEEMQIDPKLIEHAVISHQHGDHLRGVYWVFEENPELKVHISWTASPKNCFVECL